MRYKDIPSIEDYSHWNEDAEYMWYQENKYDMDNPYNNDFDDRCYDWDECDD